MGKTASLVIAASIIAVIRLRGEPIKRSPNLSATIHGSVQLARMVLEEVEGKGERTGVTPCIWSAMNHCVLKSSADPPWAFSL